MFGRLLSGQGASRRSLQEKAEPEEEAAAAGMAESSSQAQERARREEEERRRPLQPEAEEAAANAAEAVLAVEAFRRARPRANSERSKGKAPEARRGGGGKIDGDDEDGRNNTYDPLSRLPPDSPFLDQDVMGTFGRSSTAVNYSPAAGSSRFFADASSNPPLLFLSAEDDRSRGRVPSNATDRTQDSIGEVSQLFPLTPSRPGAGSGSGSGSGAGNGRGGHHSQEPSNASSDPTVMDFVEQDGIGERGGVGEKLHTPQRTLTPAQLQNMEERNRMLLKALPDAGTLVGGERERGYERKRRLEGRSVSVPDAPTPSVLLMDSSAIGHDTSSTLGAGSQRSAGLSGELKGEATIAARDAAIRSSGSGGSGGRARRRSSPTAAAAFAAVGSAPVAVALGRRSEEEVLRSSKPMQGNGPSAARGDSPRVDLPSSSNGLAAVPALERVPIHPLQDNKKPRDRKRSERSVTASSEAPLPNTPATHAGSSFEVPPRRGSLGRTPSPGLLTFLEAEQRATSPRKSLTFPRASLQESRRSLQLPESPVLTSSRQRYPPPARRSTSDINFVEERNSFAGPYADPMSDFHRISMQSRAASMSTFFASQQRARAHQLLRELVALQPRFPSKREFIASDISLKANLLARAHHYLLPLFVALPIFATIYFDFNCIFILAELATFPDDPANGSSTAWYVATGVYAFCSLAWLGFAVLVHDFLLPYRRWGREKKPLALEVYLSSPGNTFFSMKSFAHYSFLQRARWRARRRDFLAETCLFYSQNWPSMITLLPRAIIMVIVIVLYSSYSSGTTSSTSGTGRDPFFFDQMTGYLSNYARIVVLVYLAWAAWRLLVLSAAVSGLLFFAGMRAMRQPARNFLSEDRFELRRLPDSGQLESTARLAPEKVAGLTRESVCLGTLQHTSHGVGQSAFAQRAEDRLRELLFEFLPHQQMAPEHGESRLPLTSIDLHRSSSNHGEALASSQQRTNRPQRYQYDGSRITLPTPELDTVHESASNNDHGAHAQFVVSSADAPREEPSQTLSKVSQVPFPTTASTTATATPAARFSMEETSPRPSQDVNELALASMLTVNAIGGPHNPRHDSMASQRSSGSTHRAESSAHYQSAGEEQPELAPVSGDSDSEQEASRPSTRPPIKLVISTDDAPMQVQSSEVLLAPEPSSPVATAESGESDDSDERRLWQTFPEQSRLHPPGLIALQLEQQSQEDAERRQEQAREAETERAVRQLQSLAAAMDPTLASLTAPEMSLSPSQGGLIPIKEESWDSSLHSAAGSSAGSEDRSNGNIGHSAIDIPKRRGENP